MISLACGARNNATLVDVELETEPSMDTPAPSGPTRSISQPIDVKC
jgi:hypothetical protein